MFKRNEIIKFVCINLAKMILLTIEELLLPFFSDFKIQPIPMVEDNYAYLITEKSSNTGILVDPSDAATVQVRSRKIIRSSQKLLQNLNSTSQVKRWSSCLYISSVPDIRHR